MDETVKKIELEIDPEEVSLLQHTALLYSVCLFLPDTKDLDNLREFWENQLYIDEDAKEEYKSRRTDEEMEIYHKR